MCDECKETGYVGDNGAGIKGNREYEPCGCKNLTKSIEAKMNNEWKERFNNLIGCIELSINQQFDSTPIERFIEENFTPKSEVGVESEVMPKIAALQKTLQEVFDVLQEAPELNMCNYDHDQVRVLNDKMVEAYGILAQSKNKFNNVLDYGNVDKVVTEDYKEQFNKEEYFEIIELEDGKSRPEDETTKEYWRKILRRRYDPVIAFNISEHNQNIRTLKETAKEEGCLTTYRATEGYLEGLLVVVFSEFSERE